MPGSGSGGKHGSDVLRDPGLSRSAGFTGAGLAWDVTEPADTQLAVNLPGTGETLLSRALIPDPARFPEVLYDLAAGEDCLKSGQVLRRPHGMYLPVTHAGHVRDVLRSWPVTGVRFICVTDGGRLLSRGATGTGIPVGKLQLSTVAAVVPPQGLLQVYLDAGTDDETFLRDPLYAGLRRRQPPPGELYAFTEEFAEAVQEVFPDCCIHFQDWAGADAIALLARYRGKVSCYNDGIPGTAGVVLAGLINALKISGGQLDEQRILFLGAGSAATGIAGLVVCALRQQGVAPGLARQQIRMFDTQGLVVRGRPGLAADKLPYAHALPPGKPFDHLDLASEQRRIAAAIEDFRPTVLIGVSTVGKLFSREIVEAMSRHNDRPVIFALSNPVDSHEVQPQDAYAWSGGRAVYAGGVQFPPVRIAEQEQPFLPSQATSLYIFPAVAMAVYATGARHVTDEMVIKAAQAVASQVTPQQLSLGMLFPPQSAMLETGIRAAAQVADLIFEAGLARVDRPDDIQAFIRQHVYQAQYTPLT